MFACCRSVDAVVCGSADAVQQQGAFPSAATKDIQANGTTTKAAAAAAADNTQSESSQASSVGASALLNGKLGIAARREVQYEQPDVDSAMSTVITANTSTQPVYQVNVTSGLTAVDESSVSMEEELAALVGEGGGYSLNNRLEKVPYSKEEDAHALQKLNRQLYQNAAEREERQKQQEKLANEQAYKKEFTVIPQELRTSPKASARKALELPRDDEPKPPARSPAKAAKSPPRPVPTAALPNPKEAPSEYSRNQSTRSSEQEFLSQLQTKNLTTTLQPAEEEPQDFLSKLKLKKRSLEASLPRTSLSDSDQENSGDETKKQAKPVQKDILELPRLETPEKKNTGINVTEATLVLPSPAATTHSAWAKPPPTSQKPLALTKGYKDCSHLPATDIQAYETWYRCGLLHWRPAPGKQGDEETECTRPSAASPGELSPPPSPKRVSLAPLSPAATADDHSPRRSSRALKHRPTPQSETSTVDDDDKRLKRWSKRASLSRKPPIITCFGSPMARKSPPKHIQTAQGASPLSLFGSPTSSHKGRIVTDSPGLSVASSTPPRSPDTSLDSSSTSPAASSRKPPASPESSVASSVASRVKFYQNYVSSYKSYLGDRSPEAKSKESQAFRELEQARTSPTQEEV